MSSADVTLHAVRIRVTGVVQGVGFRPYTYRLAVQHRLAGWVRNESGAVEIGLEGQADDLEAFVAQLRRFAPPLAQIDRVEQREAEFTGIEGFSILASRDSDLGRLPVPPDVAMCPACERELRDPANRRYHYPFITCTDCGPRFTVIQGLPYDRERTTMRAFTQCPACLAEYQRPGDRRHHSETNSCPACGPTLWFEPSTDAQDRTVGAEGLARAIRVLQSGGIVAIRGFGGFHLACDATDASAVRLLRRRKQREAKPFAVMVGTVLQAAELAELCDDTAALLATRERPIVLLPSRSDTPVIPDVAPGLSVIGVMLPATPLHQLLLHEIARPLVMTSGNLSEEPIAIGNDEARQRLGTIADGFLLHDRDILSRADDSVLRPGPGGTVMIRRARGFAPVPLHLPVPSPLPLLAVGPHLKNTFALVQGDQAWISPHLGDLESIESLEHFRGMGEVYRRLFKVDPQAVVHDLHPGYLSTRIARESGIARQIGVQHHHAHVAAVMAEHGVTTPVLGIAYDGTGYGDDGAVWGAELLLADLTGYRRLAHFRYVPLPGGDLAARKLWRIVLGYAALQPAARAYFQSVFEQVEPAELAVAERQLQTGINCPRASSMGRLFDAAAAILGVRQTADYEGQAAMELEALAGFRPAAEYPSIIHEDGAGAWEIDPLPVLTRIALRRLQGYPVADLAADFHASIAWVTNEVLRRAVGATGITTVVLSGGTFQNARLLTSLLHRLEERGIRTLVPRQLPPGDGAISFGQAAIAAARLRQESSLRTG
jgi:hydrogenase maturation protein HypF